MSEKVAWVNGWELRPRPDGGFGVYDLHGLIAGPFGTQEEAFEVAMKLPKPEGSTFRAPAFEKKSLAS